jgi:hypothetical protein
MAGVSISTQSKSWRAWSRNFAKRRSLHRLEATGHFSIQRHYAIMLDTLLAA